MLGTAATAPDARPSRARAAATPTPTASCVATRTWPATTGPSAPDAAPIEELEEKEATAPPPPFKGDTDEAGVAATMDGEPNFMEGDPAWIV